MQKPYPTFIQIISVDYLAQNFFVMIFGGWVIFAVDAAFAGGFTWLLAIFAAVLTPLGALAFFWRYRTIVAAFMNGIETPGRVIAVNSFGRDYIIHYEYNINGLDYEYRNRVKQNLYAKTLGANRQVTLLAHEQTPHIAFIKEIYLEHFE